MKANKNNRITIYEKLYTRYSQLELTHVADRPIAISGLERRLIQALNTPGGYGVLAKYLGRSLLWRRSGKELRKIQKPHFPTPSWSWMTYEGDIEYMEIPFGQVNWSQEISSPFPRTSKSLETMWHTGDGHCLELRSPVWTCDLGQLGMEKSLVFDSDELEMRRGELTFVVVGTEKVERRTAVAEGKNHYVILLRSGEKSGDGYQRIGVGTIRAHDSDFNKVVNVATIR